MKRVSFLIDGFNLYHSIRALKKQTGFVCKWLDIQSLCASYMNLFGREAVLEKVYYFSAIATYLKPQYPQKIIKHEQYIKCLESTGVEVILGRFKNKDVYCHNCKSKILKHEEKETDVYIAIKILELLFNDECDEVVVVSGDTDLGAAAKKALELFPTKKVRFAFPYERKNKELLRIAPDSFSIGKTQYAKHLLPNPVILRDGMEIKKPDNW